MSDYSTATTINESLEQIGLHREEITSIIQSLPEDTLALMLYGSRARGDFVDSSDFDILRLCQRDFPTKKFGRVSISSYTHQQLESATGTLFGTHLKRDGRAIFDPSSQLSNIVSNLQPAIPADLLRRVRRYSQILGVSEAEAHEYYPGLVRLGRYLLRTAIYAQALELGRPCFSVRELAKRFEKPELETLLASDPDVTGPPSLALMAELRDRLKETVGEPPPIPFQTLAALATHKWDTDRSMAALAIRAASEDGESLDYSDLPKVLL
ncbi:nucleotidyltransferase domain-containing protein [Actinoplanes sp. NPDC026670]|uniref:nucleotidyltransferase domain-containing protein n=1 Tax=Actinoplanes sp. NPDC026670 TaxID=3154700 RepID=UPI0033D586D8